jgi:hypothetical protein
MSAAGTKLSNQKLASARAAQTAKDAAAKTLDAEQIASVPAAKPKVKRIPAALNVMPTPKATKNATAVKPAPATKPTNGTVPAGINSAPSTRRSTPWQISPPTSLPLTICITSAGVQKPKSESPRRQPPQRRHPARRHSKQPWPKWSGLLCFWVGQISASALGSVPLLMRRPRRNQCPARSCLGCSFSLASACSAAFCAAACSAFSSSITAQPG